MKAPFAKPIKDREEARKTLFPMGLAWHICWFLGLTFVVLGIIAGAMNTAIGLEPTHWLLLAIAVFLTSLPMLVTWALAMHLLGIGGKGKKEE